MICACFNTVLNKLTAWKTEVGPFYEMLLILFPLQGCDCLPL